MKVRISKSILLAGTASILVGVGTAAHAAAAAADETAQPGFVPEVVVVTAERRPEAMQEVPVAVTAVSDELMRAYAVNSTTDLPTVVPGLVLTQGLTNANVYMRGIGQQLDGINIEQPVATYVDGVYLFQPASVIFSFNDVSQVEVLKGPQGTLFGRNALGGVINITTQDPSFDVGWKGDLSYGNYNTVTGHFYGSTPVTDTLATSVAIYGSDRIDGYGYDVTTKKHIYQSDEWGIQNKWFWKADANTTVLLNLMYTHVANFIGGTTGVAPGFLAQDGRTRFIDTYTVTDPVSKINPTDTYLASLTVTHDLGWATFINIAAYHQLWAKLNYDVNAIPFGTGGALTISPFHYFANTVSEEPRLQGEVGDWLKWITGLYFLHDVSKNTFSPALDGFEFFTLSASLPTDSYSAYAQGTASLDEDTHLTVGLRYTEDKKSISGTAVLFGTVSTPASSGIPTNKSWGQLTERVSLDHQFTPDIMGYVSFNRGFASGTYNPTDFTNQPANPETLNAYEVGLKNQFFDKRLTLNLAGFYYDVKNLQLESLTPGIGRTGTVQLFNAATSEMYGLDVDFNYYPTDKLMLSGGFEWLHAKYLNFPGGACPQPDPAGGNPTTNICDLSGFQMSRAPDFTGTIGFQYTIGEVVLAANDNYNSGFNWEPGGLVKQKAYNALSATLTWTPEGSHYSFQLYGSNLLDEAIWAYAAAASTTIYQPGVPRLYGVKVSTAL